MGELGDRLRGNTNKTAGSIKEGIGRLTGNRRLQAEGTGQEIKGEAQDTLGKIKGALRRAFGR